MPSQDVYAPCSCGSGKKYKFCCLKKDREINVAVMSGLIRAMIRRHRDIFPEEYELAARNRAERQAE